MTADAMLLEIPFPSSVIEAGFIVGAALCLARALLGGRKP